MKQYTKVTTKSVQSAYRFYARLYDFYFGAVFHPGRLTAIDMLNLKTGDHVLEVGVGTGLSLDLYPKDVTITGIDLSAEMLAKAKNRVAEYELANVANLELMDAEKMTFPDNSFDKVIGMYVASVVPHPKAFIDEVKRVCKPGGQILLLNHFESRNWLMRGLENAAVPLAKYLGFHPAFNMDQFLKESGLEVSLKIPVNLFGLWTLLVAENRKR